MHSNLYNSIHIERKKKIAVLGLILPILGSAAGCGASSAEIPIDGSTKAGEMGAENINYQVPSQIPNILVDQVGYDIDSEKTAVFRGEELPKQFYVCDQESGDIVYSAEIMKSVYNEDTGEYDSQGYFGDLKKEGSYYLYTDVLGESYSFEIKEDIYGEVFDKACKKYYVNRCGIALSESDAGGIAHSACHTSMARLQENPDVQLDVSGGWHMDAQAGRDTGMGSRIAENLLLAYEMNPTAFSDDSGISESGNGIPDILDEVKYEVDWLLKMQDSKTGGEYGAALTDASKSGDIFTAPVYVTPVDLKATIAFASTAARFSYLYQQFDPAYATTCIKAADRAWTCFLNNRDVSKDTGAFKAAAQLYRATGSDTYHQVLISYFEREDLQELFEKDENVFLGAVTYLSINKQVDVDVCARLMKYLMRRSEDIAQRASSSGYLVTQRSDDESFGKMLDEMRCLTITDHIIYNHEYTTIIENHAHYLMGMNPQAINYVTDDTQRTYAQENVTGVMRVPENNALFIFMLSVLEQKKP